MYHFARSAKKKEMGSNSINSEAFLKSALFDFTHSQKWVSLNLHSSILKWVALMLCSDFRSALMSGAQKSGPLELLVMSILREVSSCSKLIFFFWGLPNTPLEVYPWRLKERFKELSRTRKIHSFNHIKTGTIGQKVCEGPQGIVRSRFKVDADHSTCGYQLSM